MAQLRGFHVMEMVDDAEFFRRTQTRRHKYRLQEAGLREILLREDVRGLPVAVVSLAGTMRGGKSFMLNYFIRYLSASAASRADGSWVGVPGQRLTGFDWEPGSDPTTTGILFWPEPFIIEKDGQRVAVFLMDTQGTFDSQSSLRDHCTVFALSTLVSSLQMYNIRSQIDDCHLMNLEAFTKYGIFMKEATGEGMQELKFLVRDWDNPWEYPYGDGADGGEKYKRMKLQISESQSEQSNKIRERICSSFTAITCFLMPNPGKGVNAPNFKTNPGELDEDFREELKKLVQSIFSPERLRVKTLGGRPVTAELLFSLIRSYVERFNSDDQPEPKTIFEAQSEASLAMADKAACDHFEESARRETALSTPEAVLMQLHEQLVCDALAVFDNGTLFGDQADIDNKKEGLRVKLNNRLDAIKTANNAKTVAAVTNATAAYDAIIYRLSLNQVLFVHVLDLEDAHDEGLTAAMATFDGARRRLPEGLPDPDRERLLADLQIKNDYNKRANEFNNMAYANELKNEYNNYMIMLCNQDPKLEEAPFQTEHNGALARALARFEEWRCRPSQYSDDGYKERLRQDINVQYQLLKQINASNNSARLQMGLMEYHRGSVSASDLRNHCLHPADLRELHDRAVNRALSVFRPGRPAGQGFDANNPDDMTLKNLAETHYESLVDINQSANENAVLAAFVAYKAKFDKLTDYFGYFAASWSTAKEYHEQALEVAHDVFYDHRRNRNYAANDPYIQELDAKCEHYYNPDGKGTGSFLADLAELVRNIVFVPPAIPPGAPGTPGGPVADVLGQFIREIVLNPRTNRGSVDSDRAEPGTSG